jgi:hypothetical protein
VRTHGPEVPAVRAVLYALAVRMDDDGEAFPSTNLIAADTALGERTVRAAILGARRGGWLAVVQRTRPGQAWRHSRYVACVPDSLDLAAVNIGKDTDLESIADAWAKQRGDITDPLHGAPSADPSDRARPRQPKGAAAIAARLKRERTEGAAVIAARSDCEHGQPGEGAATGAEGAAVIATKVRPPSPETCGRDRLLSTHLKYPKEVLIEGRAASDATTYDPEAAAGQATEGATETAAASPDDGSRPTVAPEVRHGEPQPGPQPLPTPRQPPDLLPSIRKLLAAGETPDSVVKILSRRGCTLHDVREALP